jgi:hypothetical protein
VRRTGRKIFLSGNSPLIKEVNISATEIVDKKLNIIRLNSGEIFLCFFAGSITFSEKLFSGIIFKDALTGFAVNSIAGPILLSGNHENELDEYCSDKRP